jgi:hypothetical protein
MIHQSQSQHETPAMDQGVSKRMGTSFSSKESVIARLANVSITPGLVWCLAGYSFDTNRRMTSPGAHGSNCIFPAP